MVDVKVALCSLVTIAIWFEQVTCDDVTDGTELVFSFLVHRHGDRTPIASTVYLSNNPEALEEYIKPYGYGQLTDEGKRTSYKIGQFVRRRYDDLLSPNYNKSEIYLRSTDSTRSKMTILTAMAATYTPIGRRWNPRLDWNPVPYTTVPAKYDFNLAFLNCPTFIQQQSIAMTGSPPALANYTDVLNQLSDILGYNVTSLPIIAMSAYDVYLSQESLGLPLSAAIKTIMPELDEVAAIIWDYVYGNEDYLHLEAGVLLNEFFQYAALAITDQNTQRVRMYAGHDANVFAAIQTYNIPTQGVVRYGGTIALEVRKVLATGKYVVLPVYLKFPGRPEKYLQVTGCDLLCDIDQFYSLTSQNALNVTEWRTECNFTEDLSIDSSSID